MLIRGELGSEEIMVNSVRRGRAQITAQSLTGTSQMVPELAVLALPYVFDSTAQMDWIFDNILPQVLAPLFEAHGLVLLNFIDSGWVGFYARDLLDEPQKVAGYKLRTPTVISAQLMAQALRADAIYIPYPDIIPALQTGLIKGGITADYPFFTGGINAEAAYFIYTRHTYDVGMLLANRAWFDSLSAPNQTLFRRAWGDVNEFRPRYRAYLAHEMAKLPAMGTQVVELTPEQHARWVSATQITHAEVIDRLGSSAQALYDTIQDAKVTYVKKAHP